MKNRSAAILTQKGRLEAELERLGIPLITVSAQIENETNSKRRTPAYSWKSWVFQIRGFPAWPVLCTNILA